MKRLILPSIALLLAACQGIPQPQPAPFASTLSVSAVSIERGGSVSVQITSNRAALYTIGGLPEGVSAERGSSTFTLYNVSAADGTAQVTVTVTPEGGGSPVQLPLTVTTTGAPPVAVTPTLSLSAVAVTLAQGASTTVEFASNGTVTTGTLPGLTVTQSGNNLVLRNDALAPGSHVLPVTASLDGQTVSANITVTVPGTAPTPLSLSASPTFMNLEVGQQQTFTVSSNLSASLTATSSVAGLQLTQSGNTFTVRNVSAPAGVHSVTVFGTGPQGQTAQTSVTVTVTGPPVPPPANFEASVSPASVTLAAGASSTVTVSGNAAFSYTVGTVSGITTTRSGNTVTLTNSGATAGSYTLPITATSTDGQVRNLSVNVTVPQTTPNPTPAPTIGVSPNSVTLAAGATTTVAVTSSTGEFTVQAPAGLTATRSGNNLTLTNNSLAPGNHTVTVQTSNASGTATATVTVTVPQPAPTFTVSVSPQTFSLARNASQTVTITANGGYTAALSNIPAGLSVSDVTGGIRFTNTSAPDGTYTLGLRVTSSAGEVRNFSLTVTTTGGAPAVKDPSIPVVSPSGFEDEVLALVNELRTQGTLQGDASVRANTCAANWTPLQPVAFHGALGYAARMHSLYLEEEWTVYNRGPFASHTQDNTANRFYYAPSPQSRADRAAQEHGYQSVPTGENVNAGRETAHATILGWLRSAGHCANLMRPDYRWAGAGHALVRDRDHPIAVWTLKMGL